MTTTPLTSTPQSPQNSRAAGWLLALGPLGFVVLVAASVVTFSSAGIGLFDDITRAQMDALGPAWVVYCLSIIVAYGLGNAGVILLAVRIIGRGRSWAIAATVLASLAVLSSVVFAILRIAASGFTEARLGDNAIYVVSDVLILRLHDVATIAVIALCLALFTSSLRRRTGLIVGIIATVYLVTNLLTGGFAPPFLISFLWLPIGISWLRGLRTAPLG